ncbi:MAG: HupE/UreJ family protein [Aquabacterium sp.]
MAAKAHKPSDSYLRLTLQPTGPQMSVTGRWDIALKDLDHALDLDADGQGDITWGEVRTRQVDIAAYAMARLAVQAGGAHCTLQTGALHVVRHSDGAYAVLPLSGQCPLADALSVQYSLFADLDPLHRGLLNLNAAGASRSAVLDPAAAPTRYELKAPDKWAQFLEFTWQGVWHIWIGFDHILFLVSLLLPAVLLRRQGQWQAVATLRAALMDVVKVVTAFTVAHSVTLSLAALQVVTLPSALVESAIAGSVVLAALNNIRPVVQGRRWLVAFGFGLIHGFGFAGVLTELGLPQDALLLALLSFNLGVELGQLAIVAAFLPLAYALRETRLYRQGILVGGSLVIAALAAVWFGERAFGLELTALI